MSCCQYNADFSSLNKRKCRSISFLTFTQGLRCASVIQFQWIIFYSDKIPRRRKIFDIKLLNKNLFIQFKWIILSEVEAWCFHIYKIFHQRMKLVCWLGQLIIIKENLHVSFFGLAHISPTNPRIIFFFKFLVYFILELKKEKSVFLLY